MPPHIDHQRERDDNTNATGGALASGGPHIDRQRERDDNQDGPDATAKGEPDVAAIARALRAADGILSNAADRLGIERSELVARVAASAELQAELELIGEQLVDLAERQLLAGVRDMNSPWHREFTEFYLSTKGRHRGYVAPRARPPAGSLQAGVSGSTPKSKAGPTAPSSRSKASPGGAR